MMLYSQYYEEILYPLQDKVLKMLKNCDLPFYLTGGTAVSRGYFGHRYSDDLDFFVNGDSDFQEHIEKVLKIFDDSDLKVDYADVSTATFMRIFINRNIGGLDENGLKVDFVNDIDVHFGEIHNTEVYYRTDSLRNILSNKYTALYRIAVKDVVDICEIAKNLSFSWADIIDEASQKEGGIDLKEVIQIFRSFDDVAFKNVKWAKKTNIDQLKENMNIIAADMLNERSNSLCG
ncbi:MAG: nucleotidyl transferase AbiEii/AbiGii toxin family protein [Spirochaetales bacterium]|nr:nucleotidyl transferase AbiEii/AbiGii toxin family protein [Spirochaetales bacterium]